MQPFLTRIALTTALAAVTAPGWPAGAQVEQTIIQRTETTTINSTNSQTDTRLLASMAEFGVRELALAEVALRRSKNPTVRQYASEVIAGHERNDKELQLLAADKNLTVPSTRKDLSARSQSKLRSLLDRMTVWSGERFDREYLNLAYSNQTEGLREYRAASAQAADADVRAYAERNLETLENQQAIAGAIAKRLAS
ncbi:DUF4142 domain-containing protein [Gloeobacter violaceus]|uniref:Gll3247 protein n=1 Tax=Gloeobacter violaceus (strain ATCC 29082 / PCC 7421) TaxID=251221 RepID=Q7NGC4_GLOVI|nr:DUF4142 domain-containing protein [Gloeobacter violaceus]BAC91188.1 gll3247 [Gloeobacter violaceus PCC 7421]